MPDTLTPAQEQVIALLSTGSTIAATAQAAGIHRNTIGHWRCTNPAFAHSLAEAQYDRILHFRDLAEEHAEFAMATIHPFLTDPDASPPSGSRPRSPS